MNVSCGCTRLTAGVNRVRRSVDLDRKKKFTANRPALWCIVAKDQLLFIARYQPSAAERHDEL